MRTFFAKMGGGALGLVLWLCTGGLMFAHIVFSILNDALILGIVGMFIPPIGLVNALSWIFASQPITALF